MIYEAGDSVDIIHLYIDNFLFVELTVFINHN